MTCLVNVRVRKYPDLRPGTSTISWKIPVLLSRRSYLAEKMMIHEAQNGLITFVCWQRVVYNRQSFPGKGLFVYLRDATSGAISAIIF